MVLRKQFGIRKKNGKKKLDSFIRTVCKFTDGLIETVVIYYFTDGFQKTVSKFFFLDGFKNRQ